MKDQLIEKFQALPDDPRQAFRELAGFLARYDFRSTPYEFDDFALQLMVKFAQRHGIRLPTFGSEDPPNRRLELIALEVREEQEREVLEELLDDYEKKIGQERFGFAILTDDEREAILSRLREVRYVVTSSNLRESKRIVLMKKLSQLEIEVNSDRTPTERFFGFMADLAFVTGEMAQNAGPAIEEFKDVLRILMRSRAKAEGVSLPRAEQWPQIPGPEEGGS